MAKEKDNHKPHRNPLYIFKTFTLPFSFKDENDMMSGLSRGPQAVSCRAGFIA